MIRLSTVSALVFLSILHFFSFSGEGAPLPLEKLEELFRNVAPAQWGEHVSGTAGRIAAEGKEVALTFDDGPHPVATPAVLQVLDDLNVRATFFLVGERVEQMPALVREIVAAGHGIGVHGYRHRPQVLLWPRHVYEDIYRGLAVVGEVTGLYPRHFRPPYGIVTGVGLRAVRRLGGETWLWTADGRDWRPRATAQGIAGRVLRQTRGGGVILLHDSDAYGSTGSWRQVLGALPTVVQGLRARGLHIRPLCDKQVICLS